MPALKKPCRGRTRRTCKRASRSCKYASGVKRSYCRKTSSTRKSRK